MAGLKERLAAAQAAGAADSEELAPVFGGIPRPPAAHEVKRLPLSRLVPWSSAEYKDQPFRPYSRAQMADMVESMRQHGLHMPIIVRPYQGQYQILAGHNRTEAARQLGWTEIDALVKPAELSDAEAADIMVDTNFNQRPVILPSEKAWGWKIKMDNMRHQGKGTSSHGGTKLRSDAELGEKEGQGRSTIQRYISLTRLIRPLLDIVDGYQYDSNGEWELNPDKPMIPVTAAEKLVDLSKADQEYLVSLFVERAITGISKGQAAELKAVASPSVNNPTKVIRRCLGLDTPETQILNRPFVVKVKLSPSLFPSTPVQKYMGDAELEMRLIAEIQRYIAEKESGACNGT